MRRGIRSGYLDTSLPPPPPSLLFLLLLLLALLLQVWPIPSAADDQATLREVQKDLPGWIPNPDNILPCNWTGVTCNKNGEVLNLTVRLELGKISNNVPRKIPSSIGKLASLEYLDLSRNNLSGPIPAQLGKLTNLRTLYLSQNLLEGPIPAAIGNLRNLEIFYAYENHLSGWIPSQLSSFAKLTVINLGSNRLEGPIPENICTAPHQNLTRLILSNNNLSGLLPSSLVSCTSLIMLRLGSNQLSGEIPDRFEAGCQLVYFEADGNGLTGTIPGSLSACANLSLINLSGNNISGSIPWRLSGLHQLEELKLSGNQLTGVVPSGLLQMWNLSLLDLSYNMLSGEIVGNLCVCVGGSKLQYLMLQGNELSGAIPHGIGNCSKLEELELGGNRLTGSIPKEIGTLSNLAYALNLSWNELTGSIPLEIGNLDMLNILDLSHNRLNGSIPGSFAFLRSLITCNASNNSLVGPIPADVDNTLLCYSPLDSCFANNTGVVASAAIRCGSNSNCSACSNPLGSSSSTTSKNWIFQLLAGFTCVVALLVFGFSTYIIINSCRQRKLGDPVSTRPMFTRILAEQYRHAIDFDNIWALACNRTNLIMSNQFGSLYKVAATQSGPALSLKKFHHLGSHKGGAFINHNKMTYELDRLAKLLMHHNIMCTIGYILHKDSTILLYDFVPLSTLNHRLHRSLESVLDWPTRYNIALGVAQGLSFLHHSCRPALLHLDITSSNIMLGSNQQVKIGDVEVTKILDPSKSTRSMSIVTGSFGYIAPEYAFTMRVTTASNVYSFGVILLELVTGRLPTDKTFGEELDLVRWVHRISCRGEFPEQVLDPRIESGSFSVRQEMLAILRIATLCTNPLPSRRPLMRKVVEMLIKVGQSLDVHTIVNH